MRKVILSMQMSLDDYATGPNDDMSWLPDFADEDAWRELHAEMWRQLERTDTMLLGRVTYQIWEKYWPAAGRNPKSSKSDARFSRYAEETEKVVFSRTLDRADWRNSVLVKNNIEDAVRDLKARKGGDIVLAGGPGLAQTFTRLDLIDEYRVIIHPVLVGSGKPLFKEPGGMKRLRLIESRTVHPGAIMTRLEPISK